ncbi:hypothetical protein J6590_033855 [Homalodisca vitripennis]|nr:hypothetical protein J6590_033855 [Homalodisca vitripennis]
MQRVHFEVLRCRLFRTSSDDHDSRYHSTKSSPTPAPTEYRRATSKRYNPTRNEAKLRFIPGRCTDQNARHVQAREARTLAITDSENRSPPGEE